MKQRPWALPLLLCLPATLLLGESTTIDDFSQYHTTEALHRNWNSFGNAASSGPATLETGEGPNASNTALFQLNWDSGDNANMRMHHLPSTTQSLSQYRTIEIVVKLEDDSNGYERPSKPTHIRLALQGGPDGSIWQTNAENVQVTNGKDYTTLQFKLSESDMTRESGDSSLQDTLAAVSNLRLRFENDKSPSAREDAYISSIIAVE